MNKVSNTFWFVRNHSGKCFWMWLNCMMFQFVIFITSLELLLLINHGPLARFIMFFLVFCSYGMITVCSFIIVQHDFKQEEVALSKCWSIFEKVFPNILFVSILISTVVWVCYEMVWLVGILFLIGYVFVPHLIVMERSVWQAVRDSFRLIWIHLGKALMYASGWMLFLLVITSFLLIPTIRFNMGMFTVSCMVLWSMLHILFSIFTSYLCVEWVNQSES